MNDPHVVALHYRIVRDKTVDYAKAEPLEFESPEFQVQATPPDRVVLRPLGHFADANSALAAAESLIRAWKLQTWLRRGPSEFCLRYEGAEVEDRDPALQGVVLLAGTVTSVSEAYAPTITVGQAVFPPPPADFGVSPDVETLVHRFGLYQRGREPLLSMANFILTMLIHIAAEAGGGRGRAPAACHFSVSEKVLRKLGEVAATRGDPRHEARKAPGGQPLSPEERRWVEETVKRLIRRVAELAFDPKAELAQITKADLPALQRGE